MNTKQPIPAKAARTGYIDLDSHFHGFEPGELVIIAGHTATGTTSLLLNMLADMVINQGAPAYMYSTVHPIHELRSRMIASMLSIDVGLIRSGTFDADNGRLYDSALQRLSDAPLYFSRKMFPRLDEVISGAWRHRCGHDQILVAIDGAQNILYGGGGNQAQRDLGQMFRAFKNLAEEANVPVITTLGLPRTDKEQRPTVYNLPSYDSVVDTADTVILVDRPELYMRRRGLEGQAHVTVAKAQNSGGCEVLLRFRPEFARFESWSC